MPKFALIGLDSISLELLERYCSDRATPHLHALMRSGTRGRALSSLPAYTPTNWAALATAAHPGTTGASGWHLRAASKASSGAEPEPPTSTRPVQRASRQVPSTTGSLRAVASTRRASA